MDLVKTLVGMSGPKSNPISITTKNDPYIANGAIRDWLSAHTVWTNCFAAVKFPEDEMRAVIMALPATSSRADVERMIEIFFNEFPISGILLINPWMAVISNSGRDTAVVVIIEETVTSVTCVLSNQVNSDRVLRLRFGSSDFAGFKPADFRRYQNSLREVYRLKQSDNYRFITLFHRLFIPR